MARRCRIPVRLRDRRHTSAACRIIRCRIISNAREAVWLNEHCERVKQEVEGGHWLEGVWRGSGGDLEGVWRGSGGDQIEAGLKVEGGHRGWVAGLLGCWVLAGALREYALTRQCKNSLFPPKVCRLSMSKRSERSTACAVLGKGGDRPLNESSLLALWEFTARVAEWTRIDSIVSDPENDSVAMMTDLKPNGLVHDRRPELGGEPEDLLGNKHTRHRRIKQRNCQLPLITHGHSCSITFGKESRALVMRVCMCFHTSGVSVSIAIRKASPCSILSVFGSLFRTDRS
eukprot:999200-Prorocentrum_minimum.AAC.1